MMTVSSVSRKTTKKTGTEKTWTVMMVVVVVDVCREKEDGGGPRVLNEDEARLSRRRRQRQRHRQRQRLLFTPTTFAMGVTRRGGTRVGARGEDQIMQKDLITAIKREEGLAWFSRVRLPRVEQKGNDIRMLQQSAGDRRKG